MVGARQRQGEVLPSIFNGLAVAYLCLLTQRLWGGSALCCPGDLSVEVAGPLLQEVRGPRAPVPNSVNFRQ